MICARIEMRCFASLSKYRHITQLSHFIQTGEKKRRISDELNSKMKRLQAISDKKYIFTSYFLDVLSYMKKKKIKKNHQAKHTSNEREN